MSFSRVVALARYRTRDRADRIGKEALERGKACIANQDPAGATLAFTEARDALTFAHGDHHEQTLPAHSGLGAAAFQARDWAGAYDGSHATLAIVAALPAEDPRWSVALESRLCLDWKMGELASLRSTCEVLLGLPASPYRATARLHLAVAHRWLHDFDAAREHGAALEQDGVSAETTALFLAGVELDAGELTAADAAYQSILAGGGTASLQAAAKARHASVLVAQGRLKEARTQLTAAEKLLAAMPEDLRAQWAHTIALDRARVGGTLADFEKLWDGLVAEEPTTQAPALQAAALCASLAEPDHRCRVELRRQRSLVERVYGKAHPLAQAAARA